MCDFKISQPDFDKIINYAQTAYSQFATEIGGMCIAKKDKDNDWIISNPVIVKQVVTAGDCQLDKDELSKYYVDAANKHGVDIKFVWWHSHHTMGVGWSGTDTKTMEEFKSGDWSMSLVVNLKREYTFRVSWWTPIHAYMDIDIEIGDSLDASIPKVMQDEVKELCETNKINMVTYPRNSRDPFGNHHNGNIIPYQQSFLHDEDGYPYYSSHRGNDRFVPRFSGALIDDEEYREKYMTIADDLLNDVWIEQHNYHSFNQQWNKLQQESEEFGLYFKDISVKSFDKMLVSKIGDVDINDYIKSTPSEL